MNNLPLKPLKWVDTTKGVDRVYCEKTDTYIDGAVLFCSTLVADYVIRKNKYNDGFTVNYGGRTEPEYNTLDEAKHWCELTHYKDKMQPYVEPDSISSYFDKFTKWGLDRGIIQNGNELAQGLKLVSEMGELADNLAKGRCIKDDIGDCMVVLNMLANMTGVKLEDCLAQAWGDIKDRKGYMNEHGVFIKSGDVG